MSKLNSQEHEHPIEKTVDDSGAPSSKGKRWKSEITVAKGPHIIMDMSWGGLMGEHLQKKVISQVSMAYSFNKKAKTSIPMLISSNDSQWEALFKRVNGPGWHKDMVTFTNEHFLDVVPADKIVYLTADTDNVCNAFDPSKYYVIGCLLDHNSKKGVTRDFAIEHNLRMERLPISENIKMDGRQVLTINHVAEVCIRVMNGESWADALVHTIPHRKNPKALTSSDENPKELQKEESHSFCQVQ